MDNTSYSLAIVTSKDVQQALKIEQSSRFLKGEQIRIIDIADEWLRERAAQVLAQAPTFPKDAKDIG